MSLYDELQLIQDKLEKATNEKAKAHVAAEQANEKIVSLMKILKDEYGLDTLEDAIDLKISLKTKLEFQMRKLQADIEKMEV